MLPIAGFTPFTTVDYPGEIAATIYTQGCPWRCPYCHNTSLQSLTGCATSYSIKTLLSLLEARRGKLDAVVFTGGEPTIHGNDLLAAMSTVKRLGFKVGLHSNGYNTQMIAECIHLIDWCGLDLKAPRAKYHKVTGGIPVNPLYVLQSLALLQAAPTVQLEVRTTWDAVLLNEDDIEDMAMEIHDLGGTSWVLQRKTGDILSNLKKLADLAMATEPDLAVTAR